MQANYSRDWIRGLKERIAQINDWRDRGLCMTCGEEMATRQLSESCGLPDDKADFDTISNSINLCTACEEAIGAERETVPILDPHITLPLRVPIV